MATSLACSPIFCAISSSVIFSVLKFGILRREWGYKASIWYVLLPPGPGLNGD